MTSRQHIQGASSGSAGGALGAIGGALMAGAGAMTVFLPRITNGDVVTIAVGAGALVGMAALGAGTLRDAWQRSKGEAVAGAVVGAAAVGAPVAYNMALHFVR